MSRQGQPQIPDEEDWGDSQQDLDRRSAHQLFSGKSRAEVLPYFQRNPIERAGDLRAMPPKPFRYYMLAFRDYVMSPALIEDDKDHWAADGASCFLNLALEKLRERPDDIRPIMSELLPALEHISSHQDRYRAKTAIYGDFRRTFQAIKVLCAKDA